MTSTALPLSGFIRLLHTNGFTIGVDHHIRLQRLLLKIPDNVSPQEIKTVLCPVFANDKGQQKLFIQLFDQYFSLFQLTEKSEKPAANTQKSPLRQQLVKHSLLWKLIFTVIILLIICIAAYYGIPDDPKVIERVTTNIQTIKQTTTHQELQQITITINPDIVPPKLTFYQKYGLVIRWSGLILPFVFFIFGVLFKFRKRQIVLENTKGQPPPTWRQYMFQAPDMRFIKNRLFYKAALLFRKRLKSNIRQFDIHQTVDATIKSSGFPVFCYKNLTRPPEYLALIHMPHPNDHAAAFNDSLIRVLKKEDIDITIYYFQDDPRLCFIDQKKGYFSSVDLWKKHRDCRLLICGTVNNFINPFTGKPESWIETFKQWPKRAILTSKPAKAWGIKEAQLANDWIVLPATIDALNAVIRYFEYPSKYVISQWIASSPDIIPAAHLNDPQKLKQWLGNSGFRWLCACAIYPEIHFYLTVKIGQSLYPDGHLSSVDLIKLIQLPWFVKGIMPDQLRYTLIRSLDTNDTQKVRNVIIKVLKENASKEGEPDFHLYTLNLAIQKWALSPESRQLKRQWRKMLAEMPESDILQEYTLVKQIDTVKTSPLQFLLPDSFFRLLYRHNIPVLGLKTGVRFLRTLMIVMLVFFFLRPPAPYVVPEKKPVVSFDFIRIPAGKFMMGSPQNEKGRNDDEISHEVELTNHFLIQTTEVTQGQWKTIMGKNPSHFSNCGDDCPVESVSWVDVQKFIEQLNQFEGKYTYRLPTEAEWEYAARAGTNTAFANGDIQETGCDFDPNLDKMSWYCGNSCVNYEGGYDCSWCGGDCSKWGTRPVAQKLPNSWKLYDMHGNVYEWCSDWYGDYSKKSVINPIGAKSGDYRLLRGGSWYDGAGGCRSAVRDGDGPGRRDYDVGVRLAASLSSAIKDRQEKQKEN